MAIDPYRTLGLEPGASPSEIKRAYRRLAKAFHPDSAGEDALPRFLAIHEAYDRLAGGSGGVPGRSGSSATSRSAPTAEPWRADPARARAAREQARTRRGRPGAPADGPRSGSRSGPVGRGAGPGPEPAERRGGDGAREAGGPRGTSAAAGGVGSSGQAGAGGATGRSTGSQAKSGRRRTTRKATLGSTSYDEARDPADPTWGGAAWYGPTSGEYWTVNPREYADPRKHGPEYQSRARRGSASVDGLSEEVAEPHAATGATDPAGGPAPTGTAGASPAAGAWARSGRRWVPPADELPQPVGSRSPVSGPPGARLDLVLGADLGDPMRRLGFALLAWAPLGTAAAAVIGQVTGCTVYSASCGPTEPLLPWLAQAGVLGILLLVPALARILAVGTLALLVALLPLAGFFVAFGGAGQSEGAVALIVLLSLAWVAGVGAAVMTAWRARGSGRGSARAPGRSS